MAKQYLNVGQVLKGMKDQETGAAKPDYIKLTTHVPTLQNLISALQAYLDGGAKSPFYLNLESKSAQLERIEAVSGAGKMSPENAQKAVERINKIPDFVRFDITTAVERKQS